MEYPIFEQELVVPQPLEGSDLIRIVEDADRKLRVPEPVIFLTRSMRNGRRAVTVHLRINDKHFVLRATGDDPRLFDNQVYNRLKLVSHATGGLGFREKVNSKSVIECGQQLVNTLSEYIKGLRPVA